MITYRTTNELRQNKDGDRTIAVINSTALDRHGTVIDPSGVDLKNYSRNPVFLINHDYNMLAGNGAIIRYQDDKLIAEVPDEAWDDEDAEIMRWKRKVKSGKMKMTSIGFTYSNDDVDEEEREVNGEKVRVPVIRRSELLEFSFVTVGSNPEALVLQRDMSHVQEMKAKIDLIEEIVKGIKNVSIEEIRTILKEEFENSLPLIRQPEPVEEPKTETAVDRSALIAQEVVNQITNYKRKAGKA